MQGRVFDAHGQPAAQARVTLLQSVYGWVGKSHILRQSHLDASGRFSFENLEFGAGKAFLEVVIDEDHAVLREPVQLATGGSWNVGDLHAKALTVLEGTVFDTETISSRKPGRRSIQLYDEATGRNVGRSAIRNGRFRITNFPQSALTLQYLEGSKRDAVEVDFSKRSPKSWIHLEFEAGELTVTGVDPPTSEPKTQAPTRLAGTITDDNGSPLAGIAVEAVSMWARKPQSEPSARTQTDAAGAFALDVYDFEPKRLWLHGPTDSTQVELKGSLPPPPALRVHAVKPSQSMRIELPKVKRLDWPTGTRSPHSPNSVPITYAVLRGETWSAAPLEQIHVQFGGWTRPLRATIPGHFPRAINLAQRARLRDLCHETLRGIHVHDGGFAVPGAQVLLEQHAKLPSSNWPTGIVLGPIELDEHGRFEGFAPPALNYTAVVTAPGYAPQVCVLYRSRVVAVELEPLPAATHFSHWEPGQSLVVTSPINGKTLWGSRRLIEGQPDPVVRLSPGEYDLVVLDSDNIPIAGQTFQVPLASPEHDMAQPDFIIRTNEDRRAQLRLAFPSPVKIPKARQARLSYLYEDGVPSQSDWTVGVHRTIGPGGPSGAMAISTISNGQNFALPGAMVTFDGPRSCSIQFNGSGAHWIAVSDLAGMLPGTYWHEWNARPGHNEALSLPPLTGEIKGSMRGFSLDQGHSYHGVAGPRLWLGSLFYAGQRNSWSLAVGLPKRDTRDADTFTIPHVLPGTFWVQDHLHSSSYFAAREGISMGANQVTVASQESTVIEDFAASEPRTVAVQVRSPDGTPFTEGTIQHVDPMHYAWAQFTQLPTTGSFASGHIPSPTRFPLDANGVATLTGVRHQNLVLELRAYAGWNLRTTFDAVPKHTEPGFKLDWTVEIRTKD